MMTLDVNGNYNPWIQPQYGFDANDVKITPPEGYTILEENTKLKHGDIQFDVYAGWLVPKIKPRNPLRCSYPDLRYSYSARSVGRWICWARPNNNL